MTIPSKAPEAILREALERIATYVEWPAQMAREALHEADALAAATPACTTCGKFSNPNCSNGFHATPPSGSGEPRGTDLVTPSGELPDPTSDAAVGESCPGAYIGQERDERGTLTRFFIAACGRRPDHLKLDGLDCGPAALPLPTPQDGQPGTKEQVRCRLYDANCPAPNICRAEGACCAGDPTPAAEPQGGAVKVACTCPGRCYVHDYGIAGGPPPDPKPQGGAGPEPTLADYEEWAAKGPQYATVPPCGLDWYVPTGSEGTASLHRACPLPRGHAHVSPAPDPKPTVCGTCMGIRSVPTGCPDREPGCLVAHRKLCPTCGGTGTGTERAGK